MKQPALVLSTLWLATSVASFTPVAIFSHKNVKSPTILQKELLCKAFDYENELCGRGTLKISFEPTEKKPAPAPAPKVESLPEVFPGIGLPPGEDEPDRISNDFTKRTVDKAQKKFLTEIKELLNKEKDNSQAIFDKIHETSVEYNKFGSAIPDKDSYKFFGNGDSAENLKILLKTNPFMAPALQSREDGNGFELKSFDPDGIENPTLYQRIIGELTGVGHRVNIQFDSKMERIEGFQMYNDVTGRQERQSDTDIDVVSSSAIYNIFAFAQTLHVTIHVLHYIYTAALQVASDNAKFEPMNQWANDYAKHVPDKYIQVGEILVTGNEAKGSVNSLITGANGLGFAQERFFDAPIRRILKEMLQDWAKNPSADGFYMDNMMNLTAEEMKSAGILEEFSKHLELSKEFAAETCEALEKTDATKFRTAENKLVEYLKNCGELGSGLESINQWVEMMAVTGAMHGSTLSYTRLALMPEVIRWRQKEVSKWSSVDVLFMFANLLTSIGMDDGTEEVYNGRHVMSKSALSGESAELLQDALDKYNEKATTLKTEYKDELIKNPMFNDYGWILSDWCPDSFDGKQLTIATYI